jgi:hypothetical protein
MQKRSRIIGCIIAIALLLTFALPAQGLYETGAVSCSKYQSDAKNAEYLDYYFGIAPFGETVSRDEFDSALLKIGAKPTEGVGTLSVAESTKAVLCAAGIEKLALTYVAPVNPDKAASRLAVYSVDGILAEFAPYIACALDTAIANPGYDFAAELDGKTASNLLMAAVNMAGKGRNMLGYSSDADIYAKLQAAWSSFANFDDPILSELGAQLVITGASTGFNLKYDGFNANFLPSYTIQYGHSSIKHAVELMGLLQSENIVCKVQLEPKVSIYEYMLDWGDPTKSVPTPTYELRPIGDNRWLCYAMEYDLKLEFDSIEDKEAFHQIIENYAKKYQDRVDENGKVIVPLLDGAWWQPLYTSTVPMQNEAFKHIVDNVIRDGAYTIHPFSEVENTAGIAAVAASVAPELPIELVDLYVNPAFYNYLTGADYQ